MFIPLLVLSTAALMILVERSRPGRSWPEVAGWWARAAALNGFQVLIVAAFAPLWDHWLSTHRSWSADWLGPTLGAILGYLAITFIYYWWHRWRHESDFLWRWVHQIHHSAQRVEVITSFYKHPVEIFINGILSSAIVYGLIGLSPQAATDAILLTGLAELFYHWNVPTPYWLGFILQRPESHCVHHQEGVHSFNYSDLPIWDMLFGTFRNPVHWQERCGFGEESSYNFWTMLKGINLSKPAATLSREQRVALALLVLGLAQMSGDILGVLPLKALAAATAASPAPKVFSSVKGLETFSTRFALEWQDAAGIPHKLELTPELYSRFHGPYNRRNVFGAALAYGPVLPQTLRDPIFSYALCGKAPLLLELGLAPQTMHSIKAVYAPRVVTEGVPLQLEAPCK